MPSDIFSCHLLMTIRSKCNQQISSNNCQTTAYKGQNISPFGDQRTNKKEKKGGGGGKTVSGLVWIYGITTSHARGHDIMHSSPSDSFLCLSCPTFKLLELRNIRQQVCHDLRGGKKKKQKKTYLIPGSIC